MYVFAQVTCICTDEGIGRFPDQNVPEKKKFVDKNVNITKNKKKICFGKKIRKSSKRNIRVSAVMVCDWVSDQLKYIKNAKSKKEKDKSEKKCENRFCGKVLQIFFEVLHSQIALL